MLSISIRKELLYFVAVIIAIVYVLIKARKEKYLSKKLIDVKDALRIAMFLYVVVIIGITLFPIVIPPAPEPYEIEFLNLDIRNIFQYGTLKMILINIIGNVLLFVPLIPLIQLNYPGKDISIIEASMVSLGLSGVIELLQYLENILAISDFPIRITDISDLFLNYFGGILGYLIIKAWGKLYTPKK